MAPLAAPFSPTTSFDAKSSEEKGAYLRAKAPQLRQDNGSLKRQLQDIFVEIVTLKSALGCAVAVGTPGTVHCEETARLEEKDIAAQTAEAYAKGEAAGRAEGERQASEERAAREAAEASVREITVRVTSLEAGAVARDIEGAALWSSKGDLAIDLEESESALLTAHKTMLVLDRVMAECKWSHVFELAATEEGGTRKLPACGAREPRSVGGTQVPRRAGRRTGPACGGDAGACPGAGGRSCVLSSC